MTYGLRGIQMKFEQVTIYTREGTKVRKAWVNPFHIETAEESDDEERDLVLVKFDSGRQEWIGKKDWEGILRAVI